MECALWLSAVRLRGVRSSSYRLLLILKMLFEYFEWTTYIHKQGIADTLSIKNIKYATVLYWPWVCLQVCRWFSTPFCEPWCLYFTSRCLWYLSSSFTPLSVWSYSRESYTRPVLVSNQVRRISLIGTCYSVTIAYKGRMDKTEQLLLPVSSFITRKRVDSHYLYCCEAHLWNDDHTMGAMFHGRSFRFRALRWRSFIRSIPITQKGPNQVDCPISLSDTSLRAFHVEWDGRKRVIRSSRNLKTGCDLSCCVKCLR